MTATSHDRPAEAADAPCRWVTPQGTIRAGMKVLAPDGTCIGTVSTLQGEELMLEGGAHTFVAMTQIAGIDDDAVLLSERGDDSFGLGAQP